MRHLCFAATLGAALAVAPRVSPAQTVPGRDLYDFAIGALGEAPALAIEAAGGLYNPAATLLAPTGRIRGSVTHLNAPGDRGLSGEVIGLEWRQTPKRAFAITVARAGVSDIPRTDDTPTAVGSPVVYDSYLVSAGASQRVLRHLAVGAALRYRVGRLDTASASTAGADAGVVVDGLLGRRDLRLGASTFLWRPGADRDDRPLTSLGADARVAGRAVAREVRVGASYLGSRGGEHEGYGYVSARLRNVEGRAGLARAARGGEADTRTRLGLGLRYAGLLVGVARDESASGFGSIYQITLSSIFK
ncbi:hypothetical protein [Roseisolibacter agri]|uniref:Uncharacterized protein n=1 Tax=Roseisolibacter agri TaxID=2014610 RepID=A0AA37QI87_9BACT|nr:hypothetical protein [Roseisolibacter agri]GLC27333.1 hypothetical protein rosag_38460 [Roseisolibacter agri]